MNIDNMKSKILNKTKDREKRNTMTSPSDHVGP